MSSGSRINGSGLRVQRLAVAGGWRGRRYDTSHLDINLGFRVNIQGVGFWVLGFRVEGLGLRVEGFRFTFFGEEFRIKG
jgi:hypothetical protein